MDNTHDPRLHVNEEARDDFTDVAVGFGVMFAFMAIVFLAAVILKANL